MTNMSTESDNCKQKCWYVDIITSPYKGSLPGAKDADRAIE